MLRQLAFGDDLAGVRQQIFEHAELITGQFDRFAIDHHRLCAGVDNVWPGIERCLRPVADTPDERAHARDQLLAVERSEEHTSELQSLMRSLYLAFCVKKKKNKIYNTKSK